MDACFGNKYEAWAAHVTPTIKDKIMSLKNKFQTIYVKIIDVNSAEYGI